ncbi:MAG: lipocalin-like domain-containing protein [Chitinophagales bacterium]|nr:lipocalin-like domain-containing protein [Chitinophagales bacterium]
MSKKLLSLLVVLVVIAGCNKEKTYKDNLNGTWEVYKYLLNNADKTSTFKAQHPGYKISFTNDGKFTELVTNPDSMFVYGTYSFTENDEKIRLENVYNTYRVDTTNGANDTIVIPNTVKRDYTIFNLTKDHVQLRNDTSQLYMNKLEVE